MCRGGRCAGAAATATARRTTTSPSALTRMGAAASAPRMKTRSQSLCGSRSGGPARAHTHANARLRNRPAAPPLLNVAAQLVPPTAPTGPPKPRTRAQHPFASRAPRVRLETPRSEAAHDAAHEPVLSSFLYASILAHGSFERALAFVLSNRLANSVLLPTQLLEIFHDVLLSDGRVRRGAVADVEACYERVGGSRRIRGWVGCVGARQGGRQRGEGRPERHLVVIGAQGAWRQRAPSALDATLNNGTPVLAVRRTPRAAASAR